MTTFSEASGRKVVDLSSAQTVGKVKDFVVDPTTRSVVALTLKKTASGDTLPWGDIQGFGPDAITVQQANVIAAAPASVAALIGKDHRLVGKRVLSTAGIDLGRVVDVDFDHESGSVTSLALKDSTVDGSRLVGVGSYAVVVKAE